MKDHDDYMNVSRHRHQRAKAILDFERNDDDELGFKKNDIISVRTLKTVLLIFLIVDLIVTM